jgi:DNA-binding XRE family transcriptional regulator
MTPGYESSLRLASRDTIGKTLHHRQSADFRKLAAQLGRRVRQLRQEHAWTVEEAAERFGIEPAHVRRIEAGRTNPSLATLLSIAHALSAELPDLLTEVIGTRARKIER